MDPSPALSFLPVPNPNPNPNPNSLDFLVSQLRSLLSLAETSLRSLPGDLAAAACPFDRRHRMPPESLFRHSLLCGGGGGGGGGGAVAADLLDSLLYPSTTTDTGAHHFLGPPPDSAGDLCFSLSADDYLPGAASRFFYAGCPAVVTSPDPDAVAPKSFTLPGFLASECANFHPTSAAPAAACDVNIGVLPSEFWLLRREAGAWTEVPASYSYITLRAAANLLRVQEDNLKSWVTSNSPQFGILIDAAMRDHIFLLLKLCLKAVKTEARRSLECLWSKDGVFDSRVMRFDCPRLAASVSWLASQLAILYGEVNGKLFAARMIQESIVQSGSRLMVMKFGEMENEKDGGENGEQEASIGRVFVSQVAAAVAALHERFFLEGRIRVMRCALPPSRSQLVMEHSYLIARGSEERAKRPNYRPVLEYDGLLSNRAQNQEFGKSKTKEELLAEERDYKRRRISYRGKKVKRNPTEVLRDIIDEHMEEIKQAGGIGCLVKNPVDNVQSSLKSKFRVSTNPGILELQSSPYDKPESNSKSPSYKKSPHADLSRRATSRIHDMRDSFGKSGYEKYELQEDERRTRHESREVTESAMNHRSYSHLHEHRRFKRSADDPNRSSYKDERDDSDNYYESNDQTSWSKLTSKTVKGEYNHMPEHRNNEKTRTNRSHRSQSASQDPFRDRYDPTVMHSDDGSPIATSYSGSDKYTSARRDGIYDEIHRRERYSRKHHQYS